MKLAAFIPAPDLTGANNYIAQANSTNTFNQFRHEDRSPIWVERRLILTHSGNRANPIAPSALAHSHLPARPTSSSAPHRNPVGAHRESPLLLTSRGEFLAADALNQGFPGNTRDWSSRLASPRHQDPIDLGLPYVE